MKVRICASLYADDFGDPAHCRNGFGVFRCAGPCRDNGLACQFKQYTEFLDR